MWKDNVRSIGPDKPFVSDLERMILACGGKFLCDDELFVDKDPVKDLLKYSKAIDLALSRRGFFGDKELSERSSRKWKHTSTFDPKEGRSLQEWDLQDRDRDRVIDSINNSVRSLYQQFYNEDRPREELPSRLREGLQSLIKRMEKGEIVVANCDKNLGFVVLSRVTYTETVMAHLRDSHTYKLIGEDTDNARIEYKARYTNELKRLLDNHKDYIGWRTEKQLLEATSLAEKKTQFFKVIVKIHKMKEDLVEVVGRPITPARGFYTSVLSRYVSDFLVKALPLVGSYTRDAADAVQRLYKLKLKKGVKYVLGTGDIPAMFTNIPMDSSSIENCIDYVLRLVNQAALGEDWPRKDFLIDAIKLVCKFNIISGPDDRLYLQTDGLAMGSSLSAAFASLSVAWREELFLNMNKDILVDWLRFADDILFLSTASTASLKEDVLPHYCGSVPKLSNIDWAIADAHLPAVFLDVSVSLGYSNGEMHLIPSLYQKELNQYSFLPYQSGHMIHMLSNWITSETRRIATLCFYKKDFQSKMELFKKRLIRRGYPEQIIERQISLVDHKVVQHELLHKELVHVDCVHCAAVIQPIVSGSSTVPSTLLTSSSHHSSSPASASRPNQKLINDVHRDADSLTRHVVLPTLPGLVQSPQSTRRLISEGFHAVESIAGLTQSRINIGWTNTPNLGKVLSKATSKGLKQRK